MYGLAHGEFGKTETAWEQLVHPEDLAAAQAMIEQASKTGKPVEGEWRIIWPDGSVHWISGRSQFIRDAEGKPLRLTGMNIDVTERKQAEKEIKDAKELLEQRVAERTEALLKSESQLKTYIEQLKKANEELRRSNADLEQFAFVASHDLREPLRAISGFLDLLKYRLKDTIGPKANEYIEFAVNGSKRMDNLLNGLLEFSRIKTHGEPFRKVVFENRS